MIEATIKGSIQKMGLARSCGLESRSHRRRRVWFCLAGFVSIVLGYRYTMLRDGTAAIIKSVLIGNVFQREGVAPAGLMDTRKRLVCDNGLKRVIDGKDFGIGVIVGWICLHSHYESNHHIVSQVTLSSSRLIST